MLSTMPDVPLTITGIFRHGQRLHGDSLVVTYEGEGSSKRTFSEVADRSALLAAALRDLGVGDGDRVATLCWNRAEHLETYFAVPCMGAVLVTLNLRLAPQQLAGICQHCEPRVLIVDASLLALAGGFAADTPSIEHVIVVGEGAVPDKAHRYEDLLSDAAPGFAWPALDERSAASMCYTTGTTGEPKGVVYGHRSTYLHSLATCTGNGFGISEGDRLLLIVPMFHANAWGLPYSGWFMGADFLMPGHFLQGPHLARLIETERATFTAGVPTVLDDVLRSAQRDGRDLSSLRLAIGGGSAVPASLIERWRDEAGIELLQGWGMTETSPLAALARPAKRTPANREMVLRAKTGRAIHGVELRVIGEDGAEVAHDGVAVGEIEVRGPWVTTAYYKDPAPEKFREGWLRTGDVGSVDERGYVQITDRLKDVIKSGGEWVSSIELENELMGHPDIVEAAVIGVPDDRWQERPLGCIVLRESAEPTFDELRSFLAQRFPQWWVPERWAIVEEIPKTSVGKFDKKVLRRMHEEGALRIVKIDSQETLTHRPAL
jgi:fatty-acyl-CoA synthase